MERPPERLLTPETPIESALEHLIQDSKIVGAGKDGIVFRVQPEALEAHDREVLIARGLLGLGNEDTVATKILKVYEPEAGDHEFQMQQRACAILRGQYSAEAPLCRVPDIAIAKDEPINERSAKILSAHGAHLTDRAEMLVMDFVDGKDLGTIMYDFVLAKNGYDADQIDAMTFSEKDQQVGALLGFEQPDTSRGDMDEIEALRARTFDRNEDKLYKYLKINGFRFEPELFKAIERTLALFHAHGLYHNDLHKQNVMIGVDGMPYIIDFGRADTVRREKSLDDAGLAKKWRGLAISDAEADEDLRRSLRTTIERMIAAPAVSALADRLIADIASRGRVALDVALARVRASDTALEQFLLILCAALAREGEHHDVVRTFVPIFHDASKRWRPAEANLIRRFVRAGFLDEH